MPLDDDELEDELLEDELLLDEELLEDGLLGLSPLLLPPQLLSKASMVKYVNVMRQLDLLVMLYSRDQGFLNLEISVKATAN